MPFPVSAAASAGGHSGFRFADFDITSRLKDYVERPPAISADGNNQEEPVHIPNQPTRRRNERTVDVDLDSSSDADSSSPATSRAPSVSRSLFSASRSSSAQPGSTPPLEVPSAQPSLVDRLRTNLEAKRGTSKPNRLAEAVRSSLPPAAVNTYQHTLEPFNKSGQFDAGLPDDDASMDAGVDSGLESDQDSSPNWEPDDDEALSSGDEDDEYEYGGGWESAIRRGGVEYRELYDRAEDELAEWEEHSLLVHPAIRAIDRHDAAVREASAYARAFNERGQQSRSGKRGRGRKRPRKRSSKHAEERKAAFREKRKGLRKERKARLGFSDKQEKHIRRAKVLKLVDMEMGQCRASKGGWIGWKQAFNASERTKADAEKAGIRIFEWDGTTTVVLVDKHGQQFALLYPKSSTDAGIARNEKITVKIEEIAAKSQDHMCKGGLRGPHVLMRKGVNHGGGTKEPCNIRVSPPQENALDELFEYPPFVDDVEEGDAAFRAYNPELYREYAAVKEYYTTQEGGSKLKWNFTGSVYAATTVNFGPRTATRDHVDAHNFPAGWCRVRAFGRYCHVKGGHLVFWDLGIAVQFPPGCSVFFPSALLVHSNLAIGENETRQSVTSYSAGGLFRWRYNGGQRSVDLEAQLKKEGGWEDEERARASRFYEYMERFFPKYT